MHVKMVVIKGYKMYRNRTEIKFGPHHNVIVGANGSGKSNSFSAIQFVLDIMGGQLHERDRKKLLHEGAGAVTEAYVEVYLDNSDGRMPVERDEVVIKRWCSLKKDTYYIDKKEASRNEVTSLLETSGLSKANPYNIVPQGKVMALTTMKDEHRLDMMMEIAGTKVYDARRAESMRIMQETGDRKVRIDEMIEHIEKKIRDLSAEKEELARFQSLDKRRKVAEYTYYHKELTKARKEIQDVEAKRGQASEVASSAASEDSRRVAMISELEREVKATNAEVKLAQAEYKKCSAENKELVELVAKLEMDHKHSQEASQKRADEQAVAARELEEIDARVAEVEAQLELEDPAADAKVQQAEEDKSAVERVEAKLQQLHSKASRTTQFASKKERDQHLSKEATELKGSLKKKEAQVTVLRQELESSKAQMDQADRRAAERRQKAAERRNEAEKERAECTRLRDARDKATDERKTLCRKEQEMIKDRRGLEMDLDKSSQTLRHSMSRAQWEAVEACRRIASQKRIKGLHGMLIELIKCDAKFQKAVDVAAGNQLFQMVVDTDETAATLVAELEKAKAGRVTFMPLNRLRRDDEPSPPPDSQALPFLSKGPAMFGLKWRGRGTRPPEDPHGQPLGGELINERLSEALGKKYAAGRAERRDSGQGGAIKVELTEAEFRALDVTEEIMLDSYVKVKVGQEVHYFKPAPIILQFEEQFRPAVAQVFRKALLVKDLETGSAKAREHNLDCITLDGDQVNSKGAMTGGHIDDRKSRMGAQAAVVRSTKALQRLDAELERIENEKQALSASSLQVLSELQQHEIAAQRADAAAELETFDLPAGAGGGSGASKDAHRAADAQKESALRALQAAVESDRERLAAVEAEQKTPFDSELSAAEQRELQQLHAQHRDLQRARDASSSEAARAKAQVASLRSSLSEHLRKRQDELKEIMAQTPADDDGSSEAISAQLVSARERQAAAAEALTEARKVPEEKRERERALQSRLEAERAHAAEEDKQRAKAAKELDRLLSRKARMQEKADEFDACIRKLGSLPQAAYDGTSQYATLSSKELQIEIEQCNAELSSLGHVNKKALDQYAAFSDERERLVKQQKELEASRTSIESLIEHLDNMKEAAIERTFKGVCANFINVFKELVPDGEGKLVMIHSTLPAAGATARSKVSSYQGVKIEVRFDSKGDYSTMQQLSGGQKTMVALCLIFAVQRCDPAPFYIFDEIDAALDQNFRTKLAAMIQKQAHAVDENGNDASTQFISTTFRPELIKVSDCCFGVTHVGKMSQINAISAEEAQRMITVQDRSLQHVGAGIGID